MNLLPLEIFLGLHVAAALVLLIGFLEGKEDQEPTKEENPKSRSIRG